ncbi:NAD(P)-binding protein [Algoriphagus aquimarinus]|uniref:NAD(P)-binding Rossmann-like domain-containing protein n=1 Tax=Algoriphagus aquimarinus TaxID=237018 RepID=A0A1I1BG04_9BACT|nr:NAD(P)-binding protein [Algoriphagus aquimarinus]SFB48682.1 NAD(P)-binding Rossmann-like domain-containing protein [Algoriphagus aquimarinus]
MTKKALIIGSGIAGITSAIRLAVKGYQVEVFEANSYHLLLLPEYPEHSGVSSTVRVYSWQGIKSIVF